MAGKPRDRRELRRQYDAAEPLDPMEDEAEEAADDAGDEDAGERKPKKKPKAPAKPKTKTPKAAKPAARMRIVWVVMNDAFKPIATFDYAMREAAEVKAKEMIEKGKGTHFVHKIKEPMPDDAPGLGAAIPRPVIDPKAAAAKESVAIEDEEEVEVEVEEEEDEAEADEPEEAEDEE
jgi:hypothetical protein